MFATAAPTNSTYTATPQRPGGTFLPGVVCRPEPVDLRAVGRAIKAWWGAHDAAITSCRPDHPQAEVLAHHLQTELAISRACKPDLIEYLSRVVASGEPRQVQGAAKIRQGLRNVGLLSVDDGPEIPAVAPASPPATARSAQPQAQVQPPAAPAQAASPHSSGLIPDLSARFVGSDEAISRQGAIALGQLIRSGRSICCLTGAGMDSHGILLGVLYLLLNDKKRVRDVETLRIFNPESRCFFGLESNPRISCGLPDTDDIRDEFTNYLDLLWDAYALVGSRMRQRAAQSPEERASAPLAFNPAVFVFPDWSHWATRWWSNAKSFRKDAIDRWVAQRRKNEPSFRFPGDDFVPSSMLQKITHYGARQAVRVILSADSNECGRTSGLTEATLPAFANLAIGQQLASGASFRACEKLLKMMDGGDADFIRGAYEESVALSRQTGRPVLLINAGAPQVWGAPNCQEFNQVCPNLVDKYHELTSGAAKGKTIGAAR